MTEFQVENIQNTGSLPASTKTKSIFRGNSTEMRILLVLGIPILAIILVFGMIAGKPQPPKKERVELDPIVDVLELKEMTANFTIRSQGNVRPRTETILSAEVSGRISRISPKFAAGGVFKANEVLMRIDDRNYVAAVEQAKALLKQREIEHDGASKLRSQGYRAESEYASAFAALAGAKADLIRAQQNLDRTSIRLPYEGMVRAKEADLGQFVNPGTRLGVTFATDFAEIRLPLTDQDLAFVDLPDPDEISDSGDAKGPAVILSSIQKGKRTEWVAQITRTEGVVDERSRVTYAVARVIDPYRLHSDGPLLPIGTFVGALIEGSSADKIIKVPRILVRGSDQLVFVDQDNKVQIRQVGIIRSDADHVYVSAGARQGERIIATALETPINGMSVRVAGELPAVNNSGAPDAGE